MSDNILIKTLIKKLWYKVDSEYNFIIEISNKNEFDFADSLEIWKNKIIKIWNELVDGHINKGTTSGRLKNIILKKIVKNIKERDMDK